MLFKNNVYKLDKNGNKKHFYGFIFGLHIRFKGKGSEIIFGEKIPKFKRCKIKLGNNCKVIIGNSSKVIKDTSIIANGNDNICKIGENFSANSCQILFSDEDHLKVEIGDNCMFAHDITIRPSDAHSVLNKNAQILNVGQDIKIGNHVWIADQVMLLKGATVADDSIIGCGSIVTKKCEVVNSLYAGIPASLRKTNINWDVKCPKKGDLNV